MDSSSIWETMQFSLWKKELQIRIVSHVIDAHFDIAAQ